MQQSICNSITIEKLSQSSDKRVTFGPTPALLNLLILEEIDAQQRADCHADIAELGQRHILIHEHNHGLPFGDGEEQLVDAELRLHVAAGDAADEHLGVSNCVREVLEKSLRAVHFVDVEPGLEAALRLQKVFETFDGLLNVPLVR